MSHLDDETLAGVALGDTEGLTPGEVEHARTCPTCSGVVDAVRDAASYARTTPDLDDLEAPSLDVWARIEAETYAAAAVGAAAPTPLMEEGGVATALPVTPPAPAPQAPAASPPPAAVPGGTGSVVPLRRRGNGRGIGVGWTAGLAAAALAIGLLSGRALWGDGTRVAPAMTTVASAELDTLDTQQRLGEATLVEGANGVDLRVDTAPLDAGDGYLEVWLINSDLTRMVSVGVLRGSGTETFPVSQELIDEGYVIVDISREGFDDQPQHSGDSLARGVLPT